MTTNGGNSQDSICPKGWKIPGRYGGDSWANLVATIYSIQDGDIYSVNRGRKGPLNFEPTGSYYTSSSNSGRIGERTDAGYWWSGTGNGPSHSYMMLLRVFNKSAGVSSTTRGGGLAIRCVVRS